MVKRYSVDSLECQLGGNEVLNEIESGEWVKFEDYALLRKEKSDVERNLENAIHHNALLEEENKLLKARVVEQGEEMANLAIELMNCKEALKLKEQALQE